MIRVASLAKKELRGFKGKDFFSTEIVNKAFIEEMAFELGLTDGPK